MRMMTLAGNELSGPQKQSGYVVVVALVFLVVLSILGLSVLQISTSSFNLSVRQSYVQIAHIASKAAIDYAEEQYELNPDWNGYEEILLLDSEKYRVTISAEVLYDQGSTAKRIRAYGRVYLPQISADADFVREIQATVIRNGEVVVNIGPEDYDPVLWLDANEPDSLFTPTASSNDQFIDALYGSGNGDIVEQRGSNAGNNPGALAFGGDDLEMSWDGNNRGNQSIGLRFRGLNTPQAATVNDAFIQFTTDETKSAGALQITVEGVADDDADSWSGNYAVDNAPKTSASVLWEPVNWNSVGASGINERVNITSLVQEIVNRPGWVAGNDIAFTFTWVQGSGVRTAEKGRNSTPSPQLYVDWGGGGAGGGEAVNNGDQIATWSDKSLNGNDALLTYGNSPTLLTGAINGLNAVRFSGDGALRSALTSTMSGNSVTAFMVMAPRVSSDSYARFLSLMNTAQDGDQSNANYDGMVPFYQNGSGTTLRSSYRNYLAEELPGAIDGAWATYSSRITSLYVERLIKNGTPDNLSSSISTVAYDFNEIFLGGRRSFTSGVDFADMDVAEVIVYDSALTCTEIQSVEDYLENKYAIPVGTKSC